MRPSAAMAAVDKLAAFNAIEQARQSAGAGARVWGMSQLDISKVSVADTIEVGSWEAELRRAMRREQNSSRPTEIIVVQLRMVLAELRAFLIVWRILALNRQSQPLYPSSTPFPQHISVLQRGGACLVTCLHCGFKAAGTNVRMLERLVQDHKCKPAPKVTFYQEH